jgi:cytochrome c-type biogenesis protein CcmE
MRRDHRFFVGLTGVAAVVAYLMWTGISDTMVYYLTPAELLARVEADRSYHDVGLKVSGRVLAGSHEAVPGEALFHRFVVTDLDDADIQVPTEYRGILPDTFVDEVEVVLEGRFRADGVFEANVVLTKCGSRYEAYPEGGVPEGAEPAGPSADGVETAPGSAAE